MKHLTSEQRYLISNMIYTKMLNQKQIANLLKVHPSTICRELKRNKTYCKQLTTEPVYQANTAHLLALKRKTKPRIPYKFTIQIKNIVRTYLALKDSPEQIQYKLKTIHNFSISHETIYQFIYQNAQHGGNDYLHLRQARRKRHNRAKRKKHRLKITDKISIDQRPEFINNKTELGHWEIDTIVGKGHKSYILTATERVSKLTILYPLLNIEKQTMIEAFKNIKHKYHSIGIEFKSFTSDNGIEFACHKEVTQNFDIPFYFAHPYSPWQRGLNENTNGLIRQFIPKTSDFRKLNNDYLTYVQNNLNSRIRKTLNFQSPLQFLNNSNNCISILNPA